MLLVNNRSNKSSARTPRGSVSVGGQRIAKAVISFSVNNNRYRQSDTFEVEFSLTRLEAEGIGLDWWLENDQIPIEVFAGFPSNPNEMDSLQSLIFGYVDDVSSDIGTNTLRITGRDLTSLLIDTRGEFGELNKSSSQMVEDIAAKHGLDAVVTATDTPVQTIQNADPTFISDQNSQWDVIGKLADIDGFDVYIKGKTLYYQPANPSGTYNVAYVKGDSFNGIQSGNFTSVRIHHRKPLTGTTKVQVLSWDKGKAATIVAVASATVTGGGSAATSKISSSHAGPGTRSVKANAANETVYTITRPGLSMGDAQALADNILKNAILHERELEIELPGDTELDCHTMMLVLSGTQSAADQSYFIDSVERSMGQSEGFKMRVKCKNHSPLETPTTTQPKETVGGGDADERDDTPPDASGTETGRSDP